GADSGALRWPSAIGAFAASPTHRLAPDVTWTSHPLLLGRDCGHPEPNVEVPVAGSEPTAVRRPAGPAKFVPAAASAHPVRAPRSPKRVFLGTFPIVAPAVAVGAPLPSPPPGGATRRSPPASQISPLPQADWSGLVADMGIDCGLSGASRSRIRAW